MTIVANLIKSVSNKPVALLKPVALIKMVKLIDVYGLTLTGGKRGKKFCAICGEMMLGMANLLKRHCERQHDGTNEGFL